MKILYVSSKKGWGGVVTWMCRTALGLGKRGHTVWMLSHPESRLTRSRPKGISIIPRKLGMDYNPAMIAYLIVFLKRNGVDLIVTNIKKEVVIGGLAARACGIPNVRRIGSHDDLNDRVKWHQTHLVDHSIVPCNYTLDEAAGRLPWIDKRRYTTIHNGMNPVRTAPGEIADLRRRWGVPGTAVVIGCTCALSTVKGLEGLIEIFAGLAATYRDAFLVLSGEGPEEAALRGMARSAGVEGRVIFAGFTDRPAKAAAAYDIGVLNSAREGFPNAILEYMGAGIPVVSTRVGGIPEILVHQSNGLLIDAGDSAALGESLRLLLDNPDLRKNLGRRAQQTVREGFSEDGMVDRVETLFKKLACAEAE
jgi:glycosyltransferase involved in cell wall biosynthesis